MVQRRNHHVIGDNSIVDRCEWSLLRRGVLKDLHDALKVIFGEGTSGRGFTIVLFEILIIFRVHVIEACDALLHRLREADVGGGLVERDGVELIVVDVALRWRRDRDLLVIASTSLLQDGLEMVFLQPIGLVLIL